ncbi:PIG-L family deacetylase [soil metagenome]
MIQQDSRGPVLVVVAHPDDEVLGCGGSIARWVAAGRPVHVLILADGEASRGDPKGPSTERSILTRQDAARRANQILGVGSVNFAGLPDNRLDQESMLEIARIVERAVNAVRPETIVTHFHGDLNVDHRVAQQAVAVAARPQPNSRVRDVLLFETLSSTEWQIAGQASTFLPTWFVDISGHLDTKLRAMEAYRTELRDFPHPRSLQAIAALAQLRGATAGVPAAEGFVLGRRIERAEGAVVNTLPGSGTAA